MYGNGHVPTLIAAGIPAAAAGGGAAAGFSALTILWLVLALVTLLSLAFAVARMIPRRTK